MREGKKELAEQKKAEVSLLKEKLNDVSELNSIEEAIQKILLQIPNLPANEVPVGRTPAENEIVREAGIKPTLHEGSLPHWDITNKYKLVPTALGERNYYRHLIFTFHTNSCFFNYYKTSQCQLLFYTVCLVNN